MRPYLAVWTRAFVIVTATATNVVNVSHGRYELAFVTGGILSYVWWGNSRTAAHSTVRGAKWAYACGAACGTVAGMLIGGWL